MWPNLFLKGGFIVSNSDNFEFKDSAVKYGLFNRKSKMIGDLFPKGKPTASECKQGITDLDCYLLSALESIVRKNPDAIKECFVDYPIDKDKDYNKKLIEFNNSPNITVRLFKVTRSYNKIIPGGEVKIKLNKTTLRSGVPWVRFIEKAFVAYRNKGYDPYYYGDTNKEKVNSRVIDGTHGSSSAVIMTAITGKPSMYEGISLTKEDKKSIKKFSGEYTQKTLSVFNKIKSALNSGKSVTACAKSVSYAKLLSKLLKKGLFYNHVYSIVDTKEENNLKYVVVGNPYKGRSRMYIKGKDGKVHGKSTWSEDKTQRGISKLELNDFIKNFSRIDYIFE